MSENAPFRNFKASEKKEIWIHTWTRPLSKFLCDSTNKLTDE